jgi:hypothetical protein
MAQMRAAAGGTNWTHAAEVVADGRVAVSGLDGTARFADGQVRGRFAQRFQLAVAGPNAAIYDGTTLWSLDVGGGVRPLGSPYARRESLTDAYLARRGYLRDDRDATVTCVGDRTQGARTLTVMHVEPRGGLPVELAVDRRTHLLASASVRTPLETTIFAYADYRIVNGIELPFTLTAGTAEAPTDSYAFHVSRYDVLARERDGDFVKPVAAEDARMVGGVASTTVPMMLEGRQLMIWASIDGHAAMPFILDTGGHAILTAQAAQTLGLLSSGAGESGGSGPGKIATQYTRVGSVRIGAAELLDQPFLVIPYPYSFSERGRLVPLAGIIGLEFFERFATRLDYGARTVTFAPLAGFQYRGAGAAVPFTFETEPDMPMVDAAADGDAGLFGIDTGNGGNLILFGTYLRKTGLLAKYVPGIQLIGQGTGGQSAGTLETLRRFTIGGHDLHDVSATFTQMQRGAFSAWTQAGNIGLSVLSEFIPTFDYARRIVYLDPATTKPPAFKNLAGFVWLKNEPAAFDVFLVRPGTPAAAAGIAAGDRIVAIDGQDATEYSGADVQALVGQPAGTTLSLRVERAGVARDVVLVLK